MPRESSVLQRARKQLTELAKIGSHLIKTTTGGEPDLVGVIDGRAFVCECKQPGKKPAPLQYARLKQWAAADAVALWYDGNMWWRMFATGSEYPHVDLQTIVTMPCPKTPYKAP